MEEIEQWAKQRTSLIGRPIEKQSIHGYISGIIEQCPRQRTEERIERTISHVVNREARRKAIDTWRCKRWNRVVLKAKNETKER
jgi:hypothetical protein